MTGKIDSKSRWNCFCCASKQEESKKEPLKHIDVRISGNIKLEMPPLNLNDLKEPRTKNVHHIRFVSTEVISIQKALSETPLNNTKTAQEST